MTRCYSAYGVIHHEGCLPTGYAPTDTDVYEVVSPPTRACPTCLRSLTESAPAPITGLYYIVGGVPYSSVQLTEELGAKASRYVESQSGLSVADLELLGWPMARVLAEQRLVRMALQGPKTNDLVESATVAPPSVELAPVEATATHLHEIRTPQVNSVEVTRFSIGNAPPTLYSSEQQAKAVASELAADDDWVYTVEPAGAYFKITITDEDGQPVGYWTESQKEQPVVEDLSAIASAAAIGVGGAALYLAAANIGVQFVSLLRELFGDNMEKAPELRGKSPDEIANVLRDLANRQSSE